MLHGADLATNQPWLERPERRMCRYGKRIRQRDLCPHADISSMPQNAAWDNQWIATYQRLTALWETACVR